MTDTQLLDCFNTLWINYLEEKDKSKEKQILKDLKALKKTIKKATGKKLKFDRKTLLFNFKN